MKFYDLNVRSQDEVSSVGELAKRAQLLGFSGIAVLRPWGNQLDIKDLKADADSLRTADFDIIAGVELQPKTLEELAENVEKLKEEPVLVVISSGNPAINKAACENSRVDILVPMIDQAESGIDQAVLEAAAKSGTAVVFCFRNVLVTLRRQRAAMLGRMSELIRAAESARVPVVISSGATSVWEMRDPRELIGLANVLGMELTRAFAAVSDAPLHVIEKRRNISSQQVLRYG